MQVLSFSNQNVSSDCDYKVCNNDSDEVQAGIGDDEDDDDQGLITEETHEQVQKVDNEKRQKKTRSFNIKRFMYQIFFQQEALYC